MSEQQKFSLKFKAQPRDYICVAFLLNGKLFITLYFGMIAAGLLALWTFFADPSAASFLPAFVALYTAIYIPANLAARSKKLGRDVQVTIDDNVVVNRALLASAEGRKSWLSVTDIRRVAGYTLIELAEIPKRAVFVPTRAFESKLEAEIFLNSAQAFQRNARSKNALIDLPAKANLSPFQDPAIYLFLSSIFLSLSVVIYNPILLTLTFVSIFAYGVLGEASHRSQTAAKLYAAKQFDKVIQSLQPLVNKRALIPAIYLTASAAALGSRDPHKAREIADVGLSLFPANADIYLNRANANLLTLQINDAMDDADRSILFNPGQAGAYLIKALCEFFLSKYDLAIEDCREAISINKNLYGAYLTRASVCAAKNLFDAALSDCEFAMALTATPSVPAMRANVYETRSSIHALRGEIDKAKSDVHDALTIDPKRPSALSAKAFVYLLSGEPEVCLTALWEKDQMQLSEMNKWYSEQYISRAELMMGNLDKALEAADRANELFANTATRSIAAYVTAHWGELEKASALLSGIISDDEFSAEAFWMRAQVFRKQGRNAEADADAETASKFAYIPYLPELKP